MDFALLAVFAFQSPAMTNSLNPQNPPTFKPEQGAMPQYKIKRKK